MPDRTLSLEERITAVLVANGFNASTGRGSKTAPAFWVTEGVGATVGVEWRDAPGEECTLLLAKYENRLRQNGLTVENRGTYLYVAALAVSNG